MDLGAPYTDVDALDEPRPELVYPLEPVARVGRCGVFARVVTVPRVDVREVDEQVERREQVAVSRYHRLERNGFFPEKRCGAREDHLATVERKVGVAPKDELEVRHLRVARQVLRLGTISRELREGDGTGGHWDGGRMVDGGLVDGGVILNGWREARGNWYGRDDGRRCHEETIKTPWLLRLQRPMRSRYVPDTDLCFFLKNMNDHIMCMVVIFYNT